VCRRPRSAHRGSRCSCRHRVRDVSRAAAGLVGRLHEREERPPERQGVRGGVSSGRVVRRGARTSRSRSLERASRRVSTRPGRHRALGSQKPVSAGVAVGVGEREVRAPRRRRRRRRARGARDRREASRGVHDRSKVSRGSGVRQRVREDAVFPRRRRARSDRASPSVEVVAPMLSATALGWALCWRVEETWIVIPTRPDPEGGHGWRPRPRAVGRSTGRAPSEYPLMSDPGRRYRRGLRRCSSDRRSLVHGVIRVRRIPSSGSPRSPSWIRGSCSIRPSLSASRRTVVVDLRDGPCLWM